jgi:hypothetical protein
MRPGRRSALAAAFFAAAAVVMTWPLVTRLGHFVSDPGDPYLTAWILRWDWRQFFRDPAHLFDANIFYPARLTLAFSENLFGAAVFGFPLAFVGLSPITVNNVLLLLGMASSGFAAWALAREMTGDAAASIVAGIFYAFVFFHFSQLPHVQMQWGPFLPLFLLFLWRFLEHGRRRDLVLYAVFFAWNAIACVHYGIFGGFALAITVGLELTRRDAWRTALPRRILAATGCSLVAIAPFAVPYFRASRLYHFRHGVGELVFYSASLKAFLASGFRSKVYAGLTARFTAPEAELFFGLLVPALAVAGFFLSRRTPPVTPPTRTPRPASRSVAILDAFIVLLAVARVALFFAVAARLLWRFPARFRHESIAAWIRARRSRPAVLWSVSMIVAGVVIALGGKFFLYRELFEIFRPILGAIRVPTRGIVLAHLGLGVLAAFGVSSLRLRFGRVGRAAVPVAAALLLLLEFRAAPISWYEEPHPEPPSSIGWMAAQRPPGGVLELPMKPEDEFYYVLWAASHDFPIVNGYSGFFPKTFEEVRRAFVSNPVPRETTSLLRRMGVSAVLFHRGRATDLEQKAISGFLTESVAAGILVPVRVMGKGADDTLIFADSRHAGLFPSGPADRAAVVAALAHPIAAKTPPIGWPDEPNNGDVIHGSTVRGNGWAASPDGIGRIAVLLDGRDVGSATYGGFRPDVPRAKPWVTCGSFCGWRYRIDGVPPGPHVIETRFYGRHGGTAAPPKIEIRVVR